MLIREIWGGGDEGVYIETVLSNQFFYKLKTAKKNPNLTAN